MNSRRTAVEESEPCRRRSAVYHVEGLNNQLQIQHGVGDTNVHFPDAIQVMDALVQARKLFDPQIYPKSNHGWARPQVWIHSTRSMFVFFERHLKGTATRN